MALRDQPYLPLYIQDFMTDEKLAECSAAANGVMIRLMCVMHKQAEYGKILLRQKYKQTDKQIENFANQLAKHFPYPTSIVIAGLDELLEEDVIQITGDCLSQARMVYDGGISLKRSVSGSKGAEAKKNNEEFAIAKPIANTEYEIESEYIIKIVREIEEKSKSKIPDSQKQYFMYLVVEMAKILTDKMPGYFFHKETDYHACLEIAYLIATMKKWKKDEVVNGKMDKCLESWGIIVDFIKADDWLNTRSLSDIAKINEWQRLVQKMNSVKPDKKRNIIV